MDNNKISVALYDMFINLSSAWFVAAFATLTTSFNPVLKIIDVLFGIVFFMLAVKAKQYEPI